VQQAQQIGDAGVELHRRLGPLVRHLDKHGVALTRAVKTYNDLLGALEGRVLPQTRKFEALGILAPGGASARIPDLDAHVPLIAVERYPKVPELDTECERINVGAQPGSRVLVQEGDL
jgi:DNA recombination protein RmuC